jgi:hypothetical protein
VSLELPRPSKVHPSLGSLSHWHRLGCERSYINGRLRYKYGDPAEQCRPPPSLLTVQPPLSRIPSRALADLHLVLLSAFDSQLLLSCEQLQIKTLYIVHDTLIAFELGDVICGGNHIWRAPQ